MRIRSKRELFSRSQMIYYAFLHNVNVLFFILYSLMQNENEFLIYEKHYLNHL
jgi:hypothetical protein